MKKFLHHISYQFVKHWTRNSVRMFYRRLEIKGLENVDNNQPVFVTSNHQNALSDPVTMGSFLKKHPNFLTRADIFSSKTFKGVFDFFKLLPIYRERDKVNTLEKNEEIFRTCIERLGNNEQIIIFPEGNHNRKYRVRPLKKGVARIAFRAAETYHFNKDVQILPVGINYFDHTQYYSDLYIHYGQPLHVNDYKELYLENPGRAIVKLTTDLRNSLKENVWHISQVEHYDLINTLRTWFIPDVIQAKKRSFNLDQQVRSGQEIIRGVENWLDGNPIDLENIREQIDQYHGLLTTSNLDNRLLSFNNGPMSMLKILIKTFLLILTLPVLVYGGIFHVIPYYLADRIAKKKFKDDHFHASIKLLIGEFTFPPYYLILSVIFFLFTFNVGWSLLFFLSLMVSGRFATEWVYQGNELIKEIRYTFIKLRRPKLFQQVYNSRKNLMEFVLEKVSEDELIKILP